jgi:hypothetical protein
MRRRARSDFEPYPRASPAPIRQKTSHPSSPPKRQRGSSAALQQLLGLRYASARRASNTYKEKRKRPKRTRDPTTQADFPSQAQSRHATDSNILYNQCHVVHTVRVFITQSHVIIDTSRQKQRIYGLRTLHQSTGSPEICLTAISMFRRRTVVILDFSQMRLKVNSQE